MGHEAERRARSHQFEVGQEGDVDGGSVFVAIKLREGKRGMMV